MFDFVSREALAIWFFCGFLTAMVFDLPDILGRFFHEGEDDEE